MSEKTPNPDDPTPATPAAPVPLAPLWMVPLDALEANPFQPRRRPPADDADLPALITDMQRGEFTLVLPARRKPGGPAGMFQIVHGHRRLEAARRAGLTAILIQLVDFSDDQMRRGTIRENLQRTDLTPWEEAIFLQTLRDEGLTYDEIVAYVGKSKGWVQNRLQLLKLEGPLREAAQTQPELLTVVNTLLLVPRDEQGPLLARVLAGELTVEDLRALVRARRDRLRRLEPTAPPADASRTAGPPPEQATSRPPATPVAAAAPADDDAIDERPAAGTVREHPADNPEGQALGLTIDNGVVTSADLDRQLRDHPTDRATALEFARELAAPPAPTPRRSSGGDADAALRGYLDALTPEERGHWENKEFYRMVDGGRRAWRAQVERTAPHLLTPAQRTAWRRLRRDIDDILTVMC